MAARNGPGSRSHRRAQPARRCRVCSAQALGRTASVPRPSEIEVKAHTRRMSVPGGAGMDCWPLEAAPPVPCSPTRPRDQLLGTLPVRALCFRPLHRVAAWLSDQGLAVSPGISEALRGAVRSSILAHLERGGAAPLHETTCARPGVSRAGLAVDLGQQRRGLLHIDPSRSAEAAHKLFAEAVSIRSSHATEWRAVCWCGVGRVRGRPGEPDAMVRGMDRADRVDLPPQR